ncbi:hypothetical protein JIN84_02620 [Luteolibacter yonseiensis]|uniref:PEP-CTERM protein-sorting domain-containing protein n=1 Tax=Luteolibacter yonseiensis TaxID=1144680 RepID=A0A934V9T8_9BACT|nr:hypothetical protein [Luteolibacter yonseiensis]MBK1814490.1 hypothetical protein [Luteolibacter yonseiensis]
MKSLALLLALSAPAFAAVTYTLPGTTESGTWTFNRTNYPVATYNGEFPNAANPWGAPAAVSSGSSSALLNKVSGSSAYMASGGFMYTAGTSSSFTLSDSSPLASLATIVFQGKISDDFSGAPTFSYNGGTQALAADFTTVWTAAGYPDRAWQWDLTGISVPITSYEINFTGHFAANSFTLDASDTFAQVIPEPTSALLGFAALSFTCIRRRRA